MNQTSMPFGSGPTSPTPRWYAKKRVYMLGEDTLTYKDDSGYSFVQPVLGPEGIELCAQCYVYVPEADRPDDEHTYVRIQQTYQLFEYPSSAPQVEDFGQDIEVECIPASLQNLKQLIKLPLLDSGTYNKALELINKWEFVVPYICFSSVLMKSDCILRSEDLPHRVPMVVRKVKATKTRQPTPDEMMLMTFGQFDVSLLSEEVELTEREVFAAALAFDGYCKSFNLYSQQLIAAWAIEQCERLALWMDMRTGKTGATTSAAKKLLNDGKCDFFLIVCPVTNMYDPWEPWLLDEGFDAIVLDGTREEDELAIAEATEVCHPSERIKPLAYVVNFERVHTRFPMMEKYWDMERVFVAADETSAIKNHKSRRAAAMHELCTQPRYVVLLNGTPMEQGPQDLWSQMKCLDTYGTVWGKSFGDFAATWLDMYTAGKYRVHEDLQMKFELLISSCSIRYIRPEADQFVGKDKTFRHVTLRPTKQIYEQTINIANGFLASTTQEGDEIEESMTNVIIRTYGFWRECACGYDKYREDEDGPYIRTRHEIDPKLVWIKAFITANPTQPLVVYVEFNEQEQRLKEMLNEMNVSWSSTKPEGTKVKNYRVKETLPLFVWKNVRDRFAEPTQLVQMQGQLVKLNERRDGFAQWMNELQSPWPDHNFLDDTIDADCMPRKWRADFGQWKIHRNNMGCTTREIEELQDRIKRTEQRAMMVRTVFVPPGAEDVQVPMWLRMDPEIISFVKSGRADPTARRYMRVLHHEEFESYKDSSPYPPSARAHQVSAFNRGESHVFILKWSQGRGISLSRKQAVAAGVGTYPAIVSCAPPWSLGNWDQGQDRCVVTDPRTGRNVNTLIYSLAIKGTIEYKILDALRHKKQVQAALLKDIEVDGYESFVQNMIEDMEQAMVGEGELFDADEMNARIELGVPPYSKLTETLIRNKAKANKRIRKFVKNRYGKVTNDTVVEWFDSLDPTEELNEKSRIARAWMLLHERIAD
jgi:hypothetical protein